MEVASVATLVGNLEKQSVMSQWTRKDPGIQHARIFLEKTRLYGAVGKKKQRLFFSYLPRHLRQITPALFS